MRTTLRRVAGIALMLPLILVLSGLVPAGASPSASQSAQGPAGLGGFTVDSRGSGVRLLYDLPGALPIGTLVDVGSPEAQAKLATGPVGSALSGLGYPGPVVLGGGALMEQGGFDSPFDVPDYPFVIQANSSGPTEVRDEETVPGSSMYAKAEGAEAQAVTVASGSETDPVLHHGGVRALSDATAGDTTESTVTVDVSDVMLLGGLIQIDAVRTELRATSDGATAGSEGGTTVSGASVLGEPVTIGPDGIEFSDPPEGDDSDGDDAPLGGVLGDAGEALDPLSAGIADLLEQRGSLNEILTQAGISVRLAEPRATGSESEAAAERVSHGVVVEFSQELGATPLADLFDLIPLLPGIPGAPVGPNDLVQILQARQVSAIAIGRGSVATSASPAFEPPSFETNIDTAAAPPALGPTPSGPSSTPSSPPSPSTPGPGGTGSSEVATGPVSSSEPFPLRGVLGPATIALAVAGALLASLGTRKLPDWAMDGAAAAGNDCTPDLEPPGAGQP